MGMLKQYIAKLMNYLIKNKINMKKLEFDIEKSSIEEMIGEATAYAGAKSVSGEGATYERVATAEGDRRILERYLSDACAAAVERLRPFVVGVNFSGERVRMTLEVSGSYEDSMQPAAESAFRSYLAAWATGRWMRLTMPEKWEEWRSETDRLLNELERNLYHRRRPRRATRDTGQIGRDT